MQNSRKIEGDLSDVEPSWLGFYFLFSEYMIMIIFMPIIILIIIFIYYYDYYDYYYDYYYYNHK
jgi:hypothetical protein